MVGWPRSCWLSHGWYRACCVSRLVFFFNDTATTEIYTLSLHDALPISTGFREFVPRAARFFEADITDGKAVERCFAEWRPEVVSHHAAQIDVRKSVEDPVRDAR